MNIISPSILSADFAHLAEDVKKVHNAQWLHVDVMDGHFVPNISIGVPVVECVRKVTNHFLDVHLMISDPLFYVEAFAKAGADLICFHAESNSDIKQTIQEIKFFGKKVGVAIKPKTKAAILEPFISDLDMILIMTVEPGFGGQSFMEDQLDKIAQVAQMAKEKNSSLLIQVDGGINIETGELCVRKGADVLVAGSFVFGNENPAQIVEELKLV